MDNIKKTCQAHARKIRSSNPGYCFKRAGWRKVGMSKSGLILLEKQP
jgi:hypothetical protein